MKAEGSSFEVNFFLAVFSVRSPRCVGLLFFFREGISLFDVPPRSTSASYIYFHSLSQELIGN